MRCPKCGKAHTRVEKNTPPNPAGHTRLFRHSIIGNIPAHVRSQPFGLPILGMRHFSGSWLLISLPMRM